MKTRLDLPVSPLRDSERAVHSGLAAGEEQVISTLLHQTTMSDGTIRTYLARQGPAPKRVVVWLHGGGGGMSAAEAMHDRVTAHPDRLDLFPQGFPHMSEDGTQGTGWIRPTATTLIRASTP